MKKFENDVTREVDRLRAANLNLIDALKNIRAMAEQFYAQGATPAQRRDRILEIAEEALRKAELGK